MNGGVEVDMTEVEKAEAMYEDVEWTSKAHLIWRKLVGIF